MHTTRGSALPPFQWLLDEHAGTVLRFLTRHVGGTDAEDCFQETMLAALRAYPSLAHGTNLRGWLLTIARRKAVDSFRASGRRPLSLEDASGEIAAAESTAPDAELWDAVGRLPAKQRRSVGLRFAGDRPYDEIARTLSISEEAARRNVHEGIKKLRREMR